MAPLLWIGRISYGIYLLHWPVFLWLTPARVGWSIWPLFALRMAVTIAAAVLMFRLIENPVRHGHADLRARTDGWPPRSWRRCCSPAIWCSPGTCPRCRS